MIGKQIPVLYTDTGNFLNYACSTPSFEQITALTTPYNINALTSFSFDNSSSNGIFSSSSFGSSSSSNIFNSSSNLFGFGSSSYSNNLLNYNWDMNMNMQENGIIYPFLLGQETGRAADTLNVRSMFNTFGMKNSLNGIFIQAASEGTKMFFSSLIPGSHIV